MNSRIEKHNLTFGVVAIAITFRATMNVSLISIPIARAINTSVDNSFSTLYYHPYLHLDYIRRCFTLLFSPDRTY